MLDIFRSAFDGDPTAIAAVDCRGRLLCANPAFFDLLGYSETQPFDVWFKDLVHFGDADDPYRRLGDITGDGVVEAWGVCKDGRTVPLLLRASSLRAVDGEQIGCIVRIGNFARRQPSTDTMSPLRRIVATLSAGNQALLQATDEESLFHDMCRVAVEQGGYRMAWMGLADNDAAKTVRPIAFAGYEDGYLAIVKMSWDDGPLGRGPAGRSVRTGQPQINNDFASDQSMGPWRKAALDRGYRASASLPLKDGNRVFGALGLYAAEPGAFGPEEVKLLTYLADDVSYGIVALRTRRDRDQLERALFQVQKLESLGQLTGGVAHDFNNLLQVILSNLDLALRMREAPPNIVSRLQNAISAAEQGAKLVRELLAFARRQPLRPEPVGVERLLTGMISLISRTIGETIMIQHKTAGDLWVALVDPNQLQNAILNLAINARDAMSAGGRLTVAATNVTLDAPRQDLRAGQYVAISIEDTGPGMPPEILDKVFEPFFTTKPEGVGTGLGLSMVYGFAKQSGGDVEIRSQVGRGTIVTLYLPRSDRPAAAQHDLAATGARGDGETILVTEDDDGVRVSVVRQLEDAGYRVLQAADGETALRMLEREATVDLLLTDVVMPGALNGVQTAEMARQMRPGLKVMFTSGYVEHALLEQGKLDPAIVMLAKPYRQGQLVGAIRDVLSRPVEPVAPTSTAEPPAGHAGEGVSGPASEASRAMRGSVLLVEDEADLRKVWAGCLASIGYRIVSVARPSEALRSLASDPDIQVAIIDYSLPEMTGLDVAREALALRPGLRIVLASGNYIDPVDLPDPSIQFILKPVRLAALREVVAAAIPANDAAAG